MTVVCFAHRQSELPPSPNMSGRPAIFEKLRARDIEPVISLLGEFAFRGSEMQVHDLVAEPTETTGEARKVLLSDVGVIVNRIGRSIKYDDLPEKIMLPPLINENATRSLAHRKHRVYDEVLKPLDIGIPTRLVSAVEDIDVFLSEHHADEFIIKPAGGSDSKDVEKVKRDAVETMFDTQPDLYSSRVIQPALNFRGPLPKYMRPYDAQSKDNFEGWSESDATKELRVYGFHSPAGTEVFPVCRAIQGGDQWFFVDPASMPERLLNVSRNAIELAAGITDARALFGTVDYGYGSLEGSTPDWHAIELNAKAPYIIGYDKHAPIADHLRELLADQIFATGSA